MLWLCICLPQLPLEALHCEPTDTATVVTACEGNTRWIICCNPAAEKVRLKAAMNYTVALAIHPQATLLERKPHIERAALERLAAWAYQFSATVIPGEIPEELRQARTAALWLEIGASRKLFGGLRKLIVVIESELKKLHYTYRLGIAPTLEGAALLARAEIRVAITNRKGLRARIQDLPVSRLMLAPEVVHQLRTAGVRTIGLLLSLPRDAVAKRFGPQLCDFLDRLLGCAADPRPAYRLPAAYAAHFEFELEVRSSEALLFPIRRALRELAGFLRARDTGIQHFTLLLTHRNRPATQLRIGLSSPDRNAERFFALTREQLERTALPAATSELHLAASEFAMPTALQPDLYSGALEQSEELKHTIDRLNARLGEEQVHGLKMVAEHRPESSWAAAQLQEARSSLEFPDRPLWLLPEPQPLQLSAMPKIVAGPERIESGWWDSADVQRDYFIVRTGSGAQLWVFQDRVDRSWHLHGFWS